MKQAYYYLYYTIFKAWSKNHNPLLSNSFRADVSVMALKIWLVGSFYAYLSIIMGTKISIKITEPISVIPFILAIASTLYFFTFSEKWKPYFEKFDKWPKRKNTIGGIIVWIVVILVFLNLIIAVNLMKKLLG